MPWTDLAYTKYTPVVLAYLLLVFLSFSSYASLEGIKVFKNWIILIVAELCL